MGYSNISEIYIKWKKVICVKRAKRKRRQSAIVSGRCLRNKWGAVGSGVLDAMRRSVAHPTYMYLAGIPLLISPALYIYESEHRNKK